MYYCCSNIVLSTEKAKWNSFKPTDTGHGLQLQNCGGSKEREIIDADSPTRMQSLHNIFKQDPINKADIWLKTNNFLNLNKFSGDVGKGIALSSALNYIWINLTWLCWVTQALTII